MSYTNRFVSLALLLVFSSACAELNDYAPVTGDIDRELPPVEIPSEGIETSLFEMLNLDYPGLEKVRQYYGQDEPGLAAAALLDYYRNRTNVTNPYVDLIAPTCTATEMNMADQALAVNGYRFYVRNFSEVKGENGSQDTYYSFAAKKDDGSVDGIINWEYVPDGVTDQEFRYQKHRHQWMEAQAKAYRVTRNEDYFANWKTVYQSWLNTYEFPGEDMKYPEPGGAENDVDYQWKGLQVAERVLSQINIFNYYVHSDNFSPEWLCRFLTMFAHQVELMRNNYYPTSNILITQAQAVATAGILMPEFRNAPEWAREGCEKLKENLDAQFLEDGVLAELDPSYHIAAISDFLEINKLVRVNGCTELLGEDFLAKLESAMTFVADITYPDYSIDNWNDTRSASYSKSVLLRNFRNYSAAFPENAYFKWQATEGASGAAPESLIASYPVAGYYMIRTGWQKNSSMVVVKNNANAYDNGAGAWHCQNDNGTFSFWHNGRNFLPDAGVYTYSTNSDRRRYAAAANHNTITLGTDNYPSGQQDVELLKCESDANNQLVVISHRIKDEINHRRAYFVVDGEFLVVVDDVYGGAQSNVTFNIHLLSSEKEPTVCPEEEKAAYTAFSDGNNLYVKTFAESEDNLTFAAVKTDYSNQLDQVSGQRAGYRLSVTKPESKSARFVTVLLPFGTSHGTVTAEFTDNADGVSALHPEGSAVRVCIDGTNYYLSYSL